MNLSPCKICGGKADWCACSDEGCHMIVCKKCKATFDLGNSTPTDHIDTLEELREQIAEVWNRKPGATNHAKECGHECYECSLNGIGAGE